MGCAVDTVVGAGVGSVGTGAGVDAGVGAGGLGAAVGNDVGSAVGAGAAGLAYMAQRHQVPPIGESQEELVAQ